MTPIRRTRLNRTVGGVIVDDASHSPRPVAGLTVRRREPVSLRRWPKHDRVAHRIAVIDRGRIVGIGSSRELKEETRTESLEEAFLALTGTSIRDENASAADQMRQVAKMWRR